MLEPIIPRYDSSRLERGLDGARLHYYLGVCYQNAGRGHDAVAQFEKFLSIVDGGDPRIEEIEDARRRLQDLRAG